MKTIGVPELARVEGEGALHIDLQDGKAVDVRLDIYEPPRFFEGFLRGRFLQEVPDITARICGICPVAYQMSSALALENALGVRETPEIRKLRRLLYCGEYIQSHALHIYMLQAPDLYGKESAFELAEAAPETVSNALRLKKLGNRLLTIIGGRSVHPVNVCVGGFYSWPDAAELKALLPELEWALGYSMEAVKWASGLNYPQLELDYESVALYEQDAYGLLGGEIRSSKGRRTAVADFAAAYAEKQVRHSNALHGHTAEGGTYLVGPLARINLNHEQLSPAARKAMTDTGIVPPIKNPYKALIARAVEMVQYFDEAIEIIKTWAPVGPPRIQVDVRAGEGCGASEAPRGLLFHQYRIDGAGLVETARIVPPTAQNLPRIEADLMALAPQIVPLALPEATRRAEDLVRSYDPCISCATHFLRLEVQERDPECR